MTCSNCVRVIQSRIAPGKAVINRPSLRWSQDTGKRRCLAHRSHLFAVLYEELQDFRERALKDLAPGIPVRLRTSGDGAPPRQIIVRDCDQSRVATQLVRNGPVQFEAAPVNPLMASKRGSHSRIVARAV